MVYFFLDVSMIKEIADKNMSKDYDVHVLKSFQPQLRIVGLSEKLTETELSQYIKLQNDHMFSESSQCEVINIKPTKKNDKVYQAMVLREVVVLHSR